MAQELIYTSFPKGVKPGVSGFCTVAVSPEMAPNMISRLEGLSGYRHLYMPGTPEADLNPPNWSHVVINVGNAGSHVIYRVADAGLDHTGRSNKLAHFIVLDKGDQAPCGPAAMLTTPGLIDLAFDQQVGTRPFTRPIPRQLVSPRPCLAWRQAAGDAGWAGELAQTAWTGKYACIVYKPGMNVLALIQEAMALLPPERRWKTTFSTYYSKLPTGIDCQWRCVVAGTPEAAQAIAEVGSGLVIDLSNGALAPAPDSPAVVAARVGRMVSAPAGTKTVATPTRQRPAQTARPASDAAVNAGIQDDLQAIDASGADDDMFSQMDSMELSTSLPQKKKKPQTASGVRYGLYAAIIAGVVLLGVVVATVFVMSNNSSVTGPKTVASNDDSSSDSQSEESADVQNSDEEDAVSDEEQQKAKEQARLEAEEKTKQEAVEKARLEAEEKARLEAEAKQKEEEEKARQEAERLEKEKKAVAEKARLAEMAKAKKEAEEKIFNDPRWIGTDRDQYFIYVDSDGVPDCTRLNLQLKKQKLQIVKLELASLYKDDKDKDGLPGFEMKLDSADSSKYIVDNNDTSTDIVIRLNGKRDEKTADNSSDNQELKKEFGNILIEGGGSYEFRDFTQQNVLLATFSDNTSKVISFFSSETDSDLKSALIQATMESYFNGSVYTVQTKGIDEKYSISKIGIGCFRDSVTVNKNSHKIVSSQINKENSSFEIQIEIPPVKLPKNIFDGQSGTEMTLHNIVVGIEKDKNSPKVCKIKYSFVVISTNVTMNDSNSEQSDFDDVPENDVKIYSIAKLIKDIYINSSDAKKTFLMQLKEYVANIPLYIDVYIQGDSFASNATRNPFLWKRIVLPPPEKPKK